MMHIAIVYVISWTDRPVKIGMTWDLKGRLESLQCGNPFELKVLKAFEVPFNCVRKIESEAHAQLADHRMASEWFDVPAAEAIGRVRDIAWKITEENNAKLSRSDSSLDQLVAKYDLDPWAGHALHHYKKALSIPGRGAEVERLNRVIVAGAGVGSLEVFKMWMNKPTALFLATWRDPERLRKSEIAVVCAINSLSEWFAEVRQSALIDEIHGNTA